MIMKCVFMSLMAVVVVASLVNSEGIETNMRGNNNNMPEQKQRRALILFDIFQMDAFCEGSAPNFQTVRVWWLVSWMFFFLQDGECGRQCAELCDHQPCFDDFVAPDDESCTCLEVSDDRCGDNNVCNDDDTCVCDSGYTASSDSNSNDCVDINECDEDAAICGSQGTCVNLPGSYECNCNDGYELDSEDSNVCVDVNECLAETNPCGQDSVCANTDGGFDCACKPGFTGNPPALVCTDINECEADENPCTTNGNCVNTPGSFECNCDTGYELSTTGTCVDTNECNDSTTCQENEDCDNNDGGFTCICKEGFTGTAGSCTDIDECDGTGAVDRCGANGVCTNTVGGFTCTCKPEFPGGEAPNCRKLEEFEKCTGSSSDCESGLTCAITSRSDDSLSCCSSTDRCGVTGVCCNGAYEKGDECPSESDKDCRGDLVCAFGALEFTNVCCALAIAGVCTL